MNEPYDLVTIMLLGLLVFLNITIEMMSMPFSSTGADLEKQAFATGTRNLQSWSNGVGY